MTTETVITTTITTTETATTTTTSMAKMTMMTTITTMATKTGATALRIETPVNTSFVGNDNMTVSTMTTTMTTMTTTMTIPLAKDALNFFDVFYFFKISVGFMLPHMFASTL